MSKRTRIGAIFVSATVLLGGASTGLRGQDGSVLPVLTGQAALSDWRQDTPGLRRHLVPADMPKPYASRSASNAPSIVDRPSGASLHVPPGYVVERFAAGLENPRLLRVAPNGDVFVAETTPGRILVLRAADGAAQAERETVFATDLDGPFGIAFYPPGPEPSWVYVATINTVVRFAYSGGAMVASGPPQVVVPQLSATVADHTTRDVQFSPDGRRMFVSVGSGSNAGQDVGRRSPAQIRAWEAGRLAGAAWGDEADRADVLAFDPDGQGRRIFADGIRNCVSLAVHPRTGSLWCATNERDGLGDNLVPDYVTRVRAGDFYGWPWYYIGANEDPRHAGERPDLAGKVSLPDVLLQPHSAPLGLAFYTPPATPSAATFPPDAAGDAFVALHGSWNRSRRTGYKVVRVRLHDGVSDATYEDFLTGFVVDDDSVWGRPVGVAVAHDGALLVTEDANGTVWRVAHVGTAR